MSERLYAALTEPEAVTDLSLRGEGLERLPDEIGRLTRLRRLDLSGNRLVTLPAAVSGLSGLEQLDLSFNRLEALPEALAGLTRLADLSLTGNPLSELDAAIVSTLTGLETLRLEGAQVALCGLPEGLWGLPRLTRLDAPGVRLTRLTSEITGCTSLRHLRLNLTALQALPPLPAGLQVLHLDGGSLDLWPSIGHCAALTALTLRATRLEELPPAVGRLEALESLTITEAGLARLPGELGRLGALQSLKLDDNPLASLPEEIGALSALTTLSARRCRLVRLPDRIGELAGLRWLRLDGNRLLSLPDSITALGRLEGLSLTENRLSTVPPGLTALPALETLRLTGNAFTPIGLRRLVPRPGLSLSRPRRLPRPRLLRVDPTPLSPRVCDALARLGAAVPAPNPEPLGIELGGQGVLLAAATRQLLETSWPAHALRGPVLGEPTSLWLSAGMGEAKSGAWVELGITAEHNTLVVSAVDARPSDPAVWLLGHNNPEHAKVRLSTALSSFLASLEPHHLEL